MNFVSDNIGYYFYFYFVKFSDVWLMMKSVIKIYFDKPWNEKFICYNFYPFENFVSSFLVHYLFAYKIHTHTPY